MNKKNDYLYLIHCYDDPYTAPYLHAICDTEDHAIIMYRNLPDASHISLINKHQSVTVIPEEFKTKIIKGIPFQDLTNN